jgi:hypothetical protein
MSAIENQQPPQKNAPAAFLRARPIDPTAFLPHDLKKTVRKPLARYGAKWEARSLAACSSKQGIDVKTAP